MQIVQKRVDQLIPYARNARTHSPEQVAKIAGSIREFGFTNPILLDGGNGVIAGHARLMAAQKLELEFVPCVELAHLTDAQKRAYIIADNKLALDSGWDYDLLKVELGDIEKELDLALTGFDASEIKQMFDTHTLSHDPAEPEPVDSFDLAHTCPKCGYEFD